MTTFANRLLRALAPADLALVEPHLAAVQLKRGAAVERAGQRISQVYFLESGIASVVAHSLHRDVGFAVLGNDGMTGLGTVLGSSLAAGSTVVQSESTAWALSPQALQDAIGASPTLHGLLLRYVHVFMLQASQTALMNVHGTIQQRLARWILMSHDRFQHNDLIVTHEFISLMLGVRRASVTQAMHALQGEGMLRSSRDRIEVRDREGLVKLAGTGYGVCESTYDRLIGPEEPAIAVHR